jgi:hypothetical protein
VKIALQKQPSPRATMAALYPMRPAGSYTTPWDTILPLPFPQDLTRLPFFLARWSKQRNRETLAYLRSKYGIAPDDAGMADYADWLSERRELMFSSFLRPLRAAALLQPLLRLRLEVRRRLASR